ncbi:hypothetical protein MSAN_00689300 [Mycena sanguinolenta]|uniref:MYND-type domain-containing protein n=1 Tax=Mycena sanguinolenta TaxID=230812 RepID=A0A8H7DCM7_9AGAR|nr:hypothetical protein MSAN_00689300 [Mycena sanguinolenta]
MWGSTFKRTFASDVYSFAFVCVELYTGKPPFSDISHDAAVILRVMAKERPPRPCDAKGRKLMSDALWTTVQQCWSHNIAERPSMARVVEMMQDANEDLPIVVRFLSIFVEFMSICAYIHSERLPHGIKKSTTLLFFPESGAEAAPEVAKALIHTFPDSFGRSGRNPAVPHVPGPLTLSTEDRELAVEVSKEFKRLGIREELCNVRATKTHIKTADKAFLELWSILLKEVGLPPLLMRTMAPPDGIDFSVMRSKPWGEKESADEMEQALKYAQELQRVGIEARRMSNSQISAGIMEQVQTTMEFLKSKSTEEAQKEADDGDDASALDYAIRIRCNIGVKPNRSLHRYYLMKVIESSTATNAQKSQAHGLLIDWCISPFPNASIFARYMFAAAHHANQSVLFAAEASPAVLFFGLRILEPQAEKVVALKAQYQPLWMALEKRKKEVEKEQEKAERKREKDSNRYICAAPECYIQASKGGGLAQCAGACDPAVKPAYCSKECQRADWKNHKPFCKPGAPCSILTKERDLPAAGQGQSDEVLTIPIAGPDGRTMMLSSSTMPPEMLKMFQDFSLGKEPEGADKTIEEMMSSAKNKSKSRFEKIDLFVK